MWDVILLIIEFIILPLFGVIGVALRKQHRQQHAMEKALVAILKKEIIQIYYSAKEYGGITMLELEAVEDMFEQYTKLGGNGMIVKLMDEIRKMDVIDD